MATCPLACLISTVLPASSLCLQEADSPCLAMHPLHLESRLNHSICSVNICWMGKIVSLLSSLVCNHRFIIFKIQFSIRNKIPFWKTISSILHNQNLHISVCWKVESFSKIQHYSPFSFLFETLQNGNLRYTPLVSHHPLTLICNILKVGNKSTWCHMKIQKTIAHLPIVNFYLEK